MYHALKARRFALVGVILTALVLLAACGGQQSSAPVPAQPQPAASAAAPAAPLAAAPAPEPVAARDLIIVEDPVKGTWNMTDEEKPMNGCVRSSRFQRNEQIVWRSKVYDPQTGDMLGDDQISVSVKLADGQVFEAKYGPHPKDPPGDYFWTAPFKIPADYPTGILNYEYVVETKDGRQANLIGFDIESSKLQILESVRTMLES